MTTAGLISHLKATSTPVWIYTMQHTGSAQVKVMSRGFLNDPNLLERLIKLSTEERSVDPNPGILLYKKTVVVPTFVDSRSSNGTVTIKIKVTASPKQDTFLNDSSTGQPIPMVDSMTGLGPTAVDPLISGSVEEENPCENLPNVWFPPPLCFVSKSASDLSESDSTTDDAETKEAHTDNISGQTGQTGQMIQRGLTADHWSALVKHNEKSLPWRGKGHLSPQVSRRKPQLDSSPHHVGQGPTSGNIFQNFPCLSALYRELSLLHEGQFSSNRRLDMKNQSVQTDHEEDQKRKSEEEIYQKDSSAIKLERPLQSLKHQYCQVREEDFEGYLNDVLVNKVDKNSPSNGRKPRMDYSPGEHPNVSSDLLKASSSVVGPPPPQAEEAGGTEAGNKAKESQKSNCESAYPKLSELPEGKRGTSMIGTNSREKLSSMGSSSSDEESQPLVIPLMTLSPPSSVNIGSQESFIQMTSSPFPFKPSPSTTGTLSPEVFHKHPHPSWALQTAGSLTPTGEGTSKEVKCANSTLGQKVYLAASIQSLDRESLAKDKEDNESVSEYSIIRDSLECSHEAENSSFGQASSIHDEEIMTEIEREISMSGDYEYSDDFESEDGN